MSEPVLLVLMAGAVRLVSGVTWSWLELLKERARRRGLAALTRAAGPGATVIDCQADGGVVTVWTQGAAKGDHREGASR
jgi:hypothetical protein